MIKTTGMILNELTKYRKPHDKLMRLVEKGRYIPIVKGLYETDKNISAYLLAASIYGPSYISFQFALSYYGLIPERVVAVTSATYNKKKIKTYQTAFGKYIFRDVPTAAFPYAVNIFKEENYYYRIASPEKALCDMLYIREPSKNKSDFKYLLLDDLRLDNDELLKLDTVLIEQLASKYHSTNIKLLVKYLKDRI